MSRETFSLAVAGTSLQPVFASLPAYVFVLFTPCCLRKGSGGKGGRGGGGGGRHPKGRGGGDEGWRVREPYLIVQELCESRGGRPGLSVLTSLLVSVDVKLY